MPLHPFCEPIAAIGAEGKEGGKIASPVVGASAVSAVHPAADASAIEPAGGQDGSSLANSSLSTTIYFGGRLCGRALGSMCVVGADGAINATHATTSGSSAKGDVRVAAFTPEPTAHHCCAADAVGGTINCLGGTSNSALLYRYVVDKAAWIEPLGQNLSESKLSELGLARRGHACSVVDDTFYVWGGVDQNGKAVKTVMLSMDLQNEQIWNPIPAAQQFGRHGHALVKRGSEIIALFGHSLTTSGAAPAVAFDTVTGVFSPLEFSTPLPSIADGVSCAADLDSAGVFCTGGRMSAPKRASSTDAASFSKLLHMDLNSLDWTELAELPAPEMEWGMTLSVLTTPDAKIVALHGGSKLPAYTTSSIFRFSSAATDVYKLPTADCAAAALIPSLFFTIPSNATTLADGVWLSGQGLSDAFGIKSFAPSAIAVAATDGWLTFSHLSYVVVFTAVVVWLILYCRQRPDGVGRAAHNRGAAPESEPLMASWRDEVEPSESAPHIPSYALNGWWRRWIDFVKSRSPDFDAAVFLTFLGEAPAISALTVRKALLASGSEITPEEIEAFDAEAVARDGAGITSLLSCARDAVILVGADQVLEKVIPLFDYNSEIATGTSVVTSTKTQANESALPDLVPSGTIIEQAVERHIILPEEGAQSSAAGAAEFRTIEKGTTTQTATNIVVTLTKQVVEPETGNVLETDYTVEIPGYAQDGWWSRMLTTIMSRYKNFDVVRFLNLLTETTVLDDATMVATFAAAGAPLTPHEWQLLKDRVMPGEAGGMCKVLTLLRAM
ncbi:hypothetical protein HK405_010348, partial [Cladochytrium tenue]